MKTTGDGRLPSSRAEETQHGKGFAGSVRRVFWPLLAVITAVLVYIANSGFRSLAGIGLRDELPSPHPPADIIDIYRGYVLARTSFDGLWWHGPWIHEGASVHGSFRPLSSLLLYVETGIALHRDFVANGWIGVVLYTAACIAAAAFAFRLTGSRMAACVCAFLGPALRFVNSKNPAEFLWWYPAHPEYVCITLILVSLTFSDLYLTAPAKDCRTATMAASLCALAAGILFKEYAYITLGLTALLAAFRLGERKTAAAWTQDARVRATRLIVAQAILVAAAYAYRHAILAHPYDPHLKSVRQFEEKSLCFMGNVWYAYVVPGDYWYPGTAILLFALAALTWHFRRRIGAFGLKGWAGAVLTAGVIIALFWTATYGDAAAAVYYICDPVFFWTRAGNLVNMVVGCAILALAWRHRWDSPLLALIGMIYVSYLPMLPFIGWHYMIQPWFLRCVMWGVAAKLIRDRLASRRAISPA